MCEIPEMWQGTFNEELVLKDMINPKVGSLYGFVVPTYVFLNLYFTVITWKYFDWLEIKTRNEIVWKWLQLQSL